MIVFFSIALYNAVELLIILFMTFKHYRGLYFWTMLLSIVLGVIPYAIAQILVFFVPSPRWLWLTVGTIGFYTMVPGQSVVLYSRLHLVVQSLRILRFVFWLVVIDTFILLIPTTVLTFLTAYVQTASITRYYNIMEHLELSWFCAQEFIISGIYIFETVRLFQLWPINDRRRTKILYELITINFFIIMFDVGLLVVAYVGFYPLETTLKSMVYSIKLKLEFAVLGKLKSLVRARQTVPAVV